MENPLEKLKNKKKLRSQLFLIGLGAVYLYMLIATGEALWQNYRINQDIAKLKTKIAQLQEESQQLQHLIAYRGTESFKEREARRKLGYKKPGEQVLAIPHPSSSDIESGQAQENEDTNNQTKITNPQKWWEYIFG